MIFSRIFSRSVLALLSGIALIPPLHAQEAQETPSVLAEKISVAAAAVPKRYAGTVEAVKHVELTPRVTGTLLKANFKEGEIIKKGTLLYEIEDTSYRAAVDGLKAQKEQMQAGLTYAEAEFKRSSELLISKAVSVSNHDKALLEIKSSRAAIKQIEAGLMDAENNLSYTRIFAPLEGRIGKNRFSEGNLISPQGGALNDIEMIAPIYVRFSLSERVFRRDFAGQQGIKENAVVRIQLADGSFYDEKAKITLISNKINKTSNSITLWASFENKDHTLLPGSFVTVLLTTAQEEKLPSVTESALIMEDNGFYVYVLDKDNRAERRDIIPGGNSTDGKRIVRKGLREGECVIIDGMHKVKPGMKTAPRMSNASASLSK